MRYQPYIFAIVSFSACALPHLEQRDEATGGSSQSGSASQSAGTSNTPGGSTPDSTNSGAAGFSMSGSDSGGSENEAGSSDLAGAGGAPDTKGGASSGGRAGATSRGGSGGTLSGTTDGGAGGTLNGGSAGRSGGGAAGALVGGSGGSPGGGGSATAGTGGCTTKNACGGCATLSGSVGDICTNCGKLTCNGFDALSCESSCAAPKAACNTTSNQCVACLTDPDCPTATPVCSTNVCYLCKPSSTGCAGTTPTSCNATGTVLTNGPVHSGTCGATCDPGALRCNNLVGQKCSDDGTAYVSSGSNTQCGCTDSTRFKFISNTQVKDATTGLVWDFPEHAADTYAGASGTCTAKGMRLPTQTELEGLLVTGTAATACSQKLYLSIDSVAFPGIVATTRYWTGDAEGPSFPGYYYVVYFFGPSTQGSASGYGTTDRTASNLVAFQCVHS